MALFLNLYVGHLLGDFLFQPGKLVVAKRRAVPGLLIHTAIIAATCTLVLWDTLETAWAAIALVTAAHLAIELLTISTYLDTRTRGLYTFLLDQALHVLSIGLVVWIVGEWNVTQGPTTFGVPVSWGVLAGGTGLLAVTFMGSILVFETVNAILVPSGGKGDILRLDLARIGGMVERGSALLAAVLLHPVALVVPFVPRVILGARASDDARKRLLLEAAAGLALCLMEYVLFRFTLVVTGV